MSAPNSVSLPKVAVLDVKQIQSLLYGLAFAKTVATASKVSFRYDYLLSPLESSVSYGENFTNASFRSWVRQEYKNQIARMTKAAETSSPEVFALWVSQQWAIRQRFFRSYQETLAELGVLNQKLGDLQLVGQRLSAVALVSAQMALVGLGIAPALVPSALPMGWTVWQTAGAKLALGLGTGIAVAVANDWSAAKGADIVLIGEAVTSEDSAKATIDNLKSGTPGLFDDLFGAALNARNSTLMEKYNSDVDLIRRQIYNAELKKNPDVKKIAHLEKRLQRVAGKGPGSAPGTKPSSAMKGLGYLFAAKSLYDASATFVKQWNGEL